MRLARKILLLPIILFILTKFCAAQTPMKLAYQAVIYDNNNLLVSNAPVGMRISILSDSVNGNPVYVETRTDTTNVNGLVDIEIGTGTVINGSFGIINWAGTSHYLKTETDPLGGNNYTIVGTSQLLSVPYALHSSTSNYATQSGNGLPSGGSNGQVLVRTGTNSATWRDSIKTEGLRYYIATTGVFPSNGNISGSYPVLGQVIQAAWGNLSGGGAFLECNGQLLLINNYQALFSLLGTSYGGDGITTFALPDLNNAQAVPRGR